MATYEQKLALEASINDDITPPLSTMDVLASLKQLDYFMKPGNNVDDDVKAVAKEEIKWMKAAMKVMEGSPPLKRKYKGFAGIQALAHLIKLRTNEKVYEASIDNLIAYDPELSSSIIEDVGLGVKPFLGYGF